jgi:hypothetical protein
LRHDGRPLLAAHVADEQRLLVLTRVGLLRRNVALGGALLGRRLHHRRLALLRYQLRRHRPRLERLLASRDHLVTNIFAFIYSKIGGAFFTKYFMRKKILG